MARRRSAPSSPMEEAVEIAPVPVPTADAEPDAVSDDVETSIVDAGQHRRRRLRVVLLGLLAATAGVLLIFSAWYLLFRKPISEFPLPPITAESMPGYGFSIYGVGRPMGIAVSPDGARIYATQTLGDAAVVAFDGRGTVLATLRPPDTGTDHVFIYVAIEPLSGDVYVTDRPMAAIHVYSGAGDYKRTIGLPAGLNGWQPLGVFFTTEGRLIVTDAGSGQVHEFAADGSLLRTIGAPGQFSFPNAAIVDGAGTMYVADSNRGRLVVLDSSGSQIGMLRSGAYEGDLGMPRGLAADDRGRIYIVDTTDQSVKVYRPSTDVAGQLTFVGRFGAYGTADGAFRFPNGVATDTRGRVYVADWSNDRVQVWSY